MSCQAAPRNSRVEGSGTTSTRRDAGAIRNRSGCSAFPARKEVQLGQKNHKEAQSTLHDFFSLADVVIGAEREKLREFRARDHFPKQLARFLEPAFLECRGIHFVPQSL